MDTTLVLNKLSISPNLHLIEIPVDKPTETKSKPVSTALNHILVIDRSGSMSGTLPQLVNDLKQKIREFPIGDSVSLAWFSGEGQYNFVLKGFKLGDKSDYSILDRALDQFRHSVGLTCFSEVLNETNNVLRDLSVISPNFALMFASDGWPVVSNYVKEINSINSALDKLKSNLTASLLVGYGSYYNKELMVDMAQRVGGALIHSSNLPHFSVALQTFVSDVKEMAGDNVKVEVKNYLKPYPLGTLFYSVNGNQIYLLEETDGVVNFPVTKKAQDYLYALVPSNVGFSNTKDLTLTESTFKSRGRAESMIKGAYGAAYLLSQRTKSDIALQVLGKLGDVALIDAINNAFTIDEYGASEELIKEAVVHPSKRLAKGRNTDYVPANDAYCILDLLSDLQEVDAQFLPSHSDFDYKRIGQASKTKEGYGKFKPFADNKVSMKSFTWNEKRLNLSLLANIKGTVDLQDRDGKSATHFGLLESYPVNVFRNYCLIKDGRLNITKLPVYMEKIPDRLLPHFNYINSDNIYVVDLTQFPIINRNISVGHTSAKELAEKRWREYELCGSLKALKWYKEGLEPKKSKEELKGGPVHGVYDFLKSNGVDPDKGTYSPEAENVKTEDYYEANTFSVSAKGCSSLPKVEEVLAKVASGSKLTTSQELVNLGIKLYNNSGLNSQPAAVKVAWLDTKIAELTRELSAVRRYIQESKFAVLLGKKWYSEFTTRENCQLTLGNGVNFEFKLGTEKVSF